LSAEVSQTKIWKEERGRQWCAMWSGIQWGPVLYQIRTSHSNNDLLQWRHVKDGRGNIQSNKESGKEQVLMEEPAKSIL
jgi:hypothetical protein